MKYLDHKLLVILILPISIHASDVYYCVEDAATGFNPEENYAVREFNGLKFKIMIDFEQRMVKSKDLFFEYHTAPVCLEFLDNLTCMNKYGTTFNINKKTLKFYRSTMFMPGMSPDSVVITRGSCEIF